MRLQLIHHEPPSLAVCILTLLTLSASPPARAQDAGGRRSITVNGDAEIKVEPDEIVLSLGVETSDKDLVKAKDLNDSRTRAVLLALRGSGVEAKYIQTDYLNIEPRYDSTPRPENFIGYFVRKTLVATINDVPRFEEILTASLGAGANYVLGIQFHTTGLRKHRDEARALAIRAAREKAIALASQLNQEIGEPIAISELGSSWYSWYGSAWWGSRAGRQMQNVVQNAGGGGPSDDSVISPGRISVTASVHVSFELR